MYWDGSAGGNNITGLTATDDYTFANYSSWLGLLPTSTARAGSGRSSAPTSRCGGCVRLGETSGYHYRPWAVSLWNRDRDKTGFMKPHIEQDSLSSYTTVSNRAIGVSGSTTYGAARVGRWVYKRTVLVSLSIQQSLQGTETFTDGFNGTLTQQLRGVQVPSITPRGIRVIFRRYNGQRTVGLPVGGLNAGWCADFLKSPTRTAGERFVFPQDEGGDAILKVEIGA